MTSLTTPVPGFSLDEMTLEQALLQPEEEAAGSATAAVASAPEEEQIGEPVREPDARDRVIERLANELARVLVSAVRELQSADGTQELGAMVRHQEDWLSATAERVTEMSHRLDDVVKEVAAQREAGTATQDAINGLKAEVHELSESVNERVEAVIRRVGLQQEEIAACQSSAVELPARVTAVVERLDRQADAIRGLWSTRSQTANALEDLMGVLSRLKTIGAPPDAADQTPAL